MTRPPTYKFGPNKADPRCRVCRGTGIEGDLSKKWTICACKERSLRSGLQTKAPQRTGAHGEQG